MASVRAYRVMRRILPVIILGASLSCHGTGSGTAAVPPQMLELSGDLAVHDPTIIREGDTFYLFATGNRRAGSHRALCG